VNQVRGLAAAGKIDSNGSGTIYATTSGLGPIEGPAYSPAGGRVWVTTNASAGTATFVDVTENGPQGNINPNQYPISGVAIDPSDASGNTAYVTVMGFTGGAGHVWKTTNAGVSWSDFTGNLPDSPANAVVVYAPMSQVFVATDVGVFASPTSAPNWTELGPNPSTNQAGFLPNVAVTALGVFNRGGQQLLRASTYGRGMWQFNLVITPDFQFSVSNSPLTAFVGQTASFNGTITAVNGYTNSVTLSCTAGTTAPPSTCTSSPASFTPGNKTPFTVAVGGAAGDYTFNLKAIGADTSHITHTIPLILHLLNFGITTPSPTSVTVSRGSTSSPVSFQITAAGSFSQSVTVACTTSIPSATCNLTPGATVNPKLGSPVNMTASVVVPAGTAAGTYPVTLQATTSGAAAPLTTSFNLVVTANPDFVMSEPSAFPAFNAGSTGGNGPISITSQEGFSGTVTLTCPATYGAGSCSITPGSVSAFPATVTLTINGSFFAAGAYSLSVSGTSGSLVHTLDVPFTVGDYSISGTQAILANPGAQAKASLQLTSAFSYGGKINATCDASSLPGAMCTLTPANPQTLASGGTTSLGATINVPNDANAGQYNIKINTQDTSGAPSHSANIALTIAQDFLVTSSTASQTVTAGQTSGAYALRVLPVGSSFNGAVSLACSAGLPAGAQCVFNPSTAVTPGNSAVDVVMNISTTARSAHSETTVKGNFFPPAMWVPLAAIVISMSVSGNRSPTRFRQLSGCFVFCLMMMAFVSCAGVSNGGGGGGQPPPPVTYHITVTGASSGTPPDAGQSIIVTLVVN
jgi:hypothetical protein